MTEKQFVEMIGPLATKDMKQLGILASITAAQACLESGYGSTDLAKKANNLFGMKQTLSGNIWTSVWDGKSTYAKQTAEQDKNGNEYYVWAHFRKYPDIRTSIRDHSLYLTQAKNGSKLRYTGLAGCKDYKWAAQLIKNGGYATDVKYVSKICSLIERWNLTQYDKEIEIMTLKRNTQYVSNNNTKSGTMTPKYIVIHNTDNYNAGANALAHAKAQYQGNFADMSCHWYVDDSGTVYQATPHNKGAWHVGRNYGGRLFGTASNNNTVGIEMCVQKGYNYEKAFQNTVTLCKYLMDVLGIDADHVVQHYDVCGKNCPSAIRSKGDWTRFKKLISSATTNTPTTPTTPKGDTYMFTCKTVQNGSNGLEVLLLQEILKARGYYTGELDRSFGAQTKKAVEKYQKDRKGGAGPVDGICGPKTWADLIAL